MGLSFLVLQGTDFLIQGLEASSKGKVAGRETLSCLVRLDKLSCSQDATLCGKGDSLLFVVCSPGSGDLLRFYDAF